MEENQKDPQVTDNQTGQKNPSLSNQDPQGKNVNPSEIRSDADEDENKDEEQKNPQKEVPDREHQHDYKTPGNDQSRSGGSQIGNQGGSKSIISEEITDEGDEGQTHIPGNISNTGKTPATEPDNKGKQIEIEPTQYDTEVNKGQSSNPGNTQNTYQGSE